MLFEIFLSKQYYLWFHSIVPFIFQIITKSIAEEIVIRDGDKKILAFIMEGN